MCGGNGMKEMDVEEDFVIPSLYCIRFLLTIFHIESLFFLKNVDNIATHISLI